MGGQIGRSLARSAVDDQLLFQEQVFGDDGSAATWSNQLGQGGEQVKKQINGVLYTLRG